MSCSCSTGKAELKLLRFALLGLGLVLFAVLIAENDPSTVLASVAELSWRLGVILCFPVVLVQVFDTLGWRYAFLRESVAFAALVSARVAGEAFNLITPTAALGGEAVKAWLLRERAPIEASLSSVIVAKTTITIAQGLFLLVGIAVAWGTILSGSTLLYGMLWLLTIEAVALGLFVLVQMRGMLGWTGRLLERLGIYAGREHATLGRVDDALGQFYRTAPRRLMLSIAFHFVA